MAITGGLDSELDHFMIASPDLERTVESFQRRTGIRPVFGGDYASI